MSISVEKLLSREEIRHRLNTYCRAVDRRDWDLLRTCFHPDAYDDHGYFSGRPDEFVEWLARRHVKIGQSFHIITNMVFLRETDSEADVESYAVAFQRKAVDAIPLYSVGVRYLDRFERRDDEWRIAHRRVVYEWSERLEASGAFLGDAAVHRARRDDSDASYELAPVQRPSSVD